MAVQKSKRRVHFVPIVLFCAGDQWFLCPSFVRLVIDRQPTTICYHPASQGGPGPLQRVSAFYRAANRLLLHFVTSWWPNSPGHQAASFHTPSIKLTKFHSVPFNGNAL